MVTELWRSALDKGGAVGALAMDLSKAFDCLPHDLIVAKLLAYGMSEKSVTLFCSYLRGRFQRVKIGDARSTWREVLKGVPQGSILGPALFNIFLNDIVYFFERSILANFADDNTLIVQGENLQTVVNTLGQEGSIATDWFASNFMKANPDKFHFMSAAKKADAAVNTIEIESNSIQAEDSIKLLGVHIDSRLNFNKQKKAGRQINALKRLSFYLNYNARLTAFRCFILSHLNYSPLVWMNSSKVQMGKIEKLQERAHGKK